MPKILGHFLYALEFYNNTITLIPQEFLQVGSDCECSTPKMFCFTEDRLQFTCQEVSEGWEVYPTEGNEVSPESGNFHCISFNLK